MYITQNLSWQNKMMEARLTQLHGTSQVCSSQSSASTATSDVDERAIAESVLGFHRGHQCGIGRRLPGYSSSVSPSAVGASIRSQSLPSVTPQVTQEQM